MAGQTPDLAELELADLELAVAALGIEAFHARQLYRWIHRGAVTDFGLMTDLSKRHREALASAFTVSCPGVVGRRRSSDGTTKFLLEPADRRRIEAVYIPNSPAHTFCLSTQVGCAMQCAFCLTAKMGLERHLTAGEIAGQVRALALDLNLLEQPINVVLMGMGEPLRLVQLLAGLRAKVNVIPLNEALWNPLRPPVSPSDRSVWPAVGRA